MIVLSTSDRRREREMKDTPSLNRINVDIESPETAKACSREEKKKFETLVGKTNTESQSSYRIENEARLRSQSSVPVLINDEGHVRIHLVYC